MSNINITPFYSRGYEQTEVKTISSREVADMMETPHYKVLEKLEGTKDGKTKGIIPTLIAHEIVVNDYFIESSYVALNGKANKEYLCTKLGCDFLANKFTGEKGVLFTAKYVKRFDQMEKHINQQLDSYMIADPIERAKRWIEEQSLANQQIEQLEVVNTALNQQIGELKPKADYTDMVLQSKSLMTITAIAKDYGMTGGALNKKLHELSIQYKQSGQWFLYAEHQTKGYTSSSTTIIEHKDGSTEVKLHTKWTQKGRLFIYDELKKKGILPLIEQEVAC